MVTVAGVLGSKKAPRYALRENYRDWIVRQCLSSPIDISQTGASPQYWADDDVQFASNEVYKSMMNFRDITINLSTSSSLLEMFHGSTLATSWDRGRQYHLDIFCRNFYLQTGIVNGEIATSETVNKSYAGETNDTREYEHGYSRHANTVIKAALAAAAAQSTGGGGWGAATGAGSTSVPRLQHLNALTEAQLFLTDQGLMNPYPPTYFNNAGTPARNGQWPAHEFLSTVDWGKGGAARGGLSCLSAFGGFAWTSSAPDLASGPGGHIRIFALESCRIGANGTIRARGNQSATRGGGGGTIEIISNSISIEGNVTDQLDARGGGSGTSNAGGGGGIFLYSPSISYSSADQFNTSGRMATGTKGLIIDKTTDTVVRSTKVRGSGLTVMYPIERLPTSL
jgi:hypothetical protein